MVPRAPDTRMIDGRKHEETRETHQIQGSLEIRCQAKDKTGCQAEDEICCQAEDEIGGEGEDQQNAGQEDGETQGVRAFQHRIEAQARREEGGNRGSARGRHRRDRHRARRVQSR